MMAEITAEQSKLDKLTKKIAGYKAEESGKKTQKHRIVAEVESPRLLDTKSQSTKIYLSTDDFQKVPKETIKRILELLKNYVEMDKSFRLKHESLKTLYEAYIDLYKKYRESKAQAGSSDASVESSSSSGYAIDNIIKRITDEPSKSNVSSKDNENNDVIVIDTKKHDETLKNIHLEMKENNSRLYKERLSILKKIREHPEIQKEMKDKLCGRLIAIFKAPPIPEYKPLVLLAREATSNEDPIYGEEKISVSELDSAYLQKHNELMTVFKAYQNLYTKVLNYKEQLEKYRKLPTGSSISRCEMEKMLKDQRFVMDMIDKMQGNLVENKILSDSERVLVTPVASNPDNINAFNDTMRNQIRHIIDRQVDINPGTRSKIENLLKQYQKCDSNDEFCKSGREILLLKKISK